MTDFIDSIATIGSFLLKAIEFFFFTIVVKYIVVRWIAEKTKKYFVKFFVVSEREVAIWMHYRNKAMDAGHTDPIHKCDDGRCSGF